MEVSYREIRPALCKLSQVRFYYQNYFTSKVPKSSVLPCELSLVTQNGFQCPRMLLSYFQCCFYIILRYFYLSGLSAAAGARPAMTEPALALTSHAPSSCHVRLLLHSVASIKGKLHTSSLRQPKPVFALA